MDTITEHDFDRWLTEERAISLAVAEEAGIDLITTAFGEEVKIPVRDFNGNHMFNKYRRSPWSDRGTKYRYDHGSHGYIFGGESLLQVPPGERVVITEGELDSLALRSTGYNAISSTGGAGMFRAEWCDLLKPYDLTLLYDADKAGVEGALRAASLMPMKIAWIPVQFGKDATDVIASGEADALHEAINNAAEYQLPLRDSEANVRISGYKRVMDQMYSEKLATLRDAAATPFHRDIAIMWLQDELKRAEDEIARSHVNRPVIEGKAVENAKAYPISRLVKVSREGFTNCVYHEEKSASMKIYKDNHAFSYCCSRRSDAIDIYQAIHQGTSFKDAIRALGI